jgi:DNA-binding MarR family transcriptional regulator
MQQRAMNIRETEAKKLAKTMANECIAFRVRLLSRVVTNLYNRALQPLGVKANQVTILVLLISSEKFSPGDVGQALHMEKSTVSRNIERMRAKGWIEKQRGDGDSSHFLMVTPEGRDLLMEVHAKWQEAQQQARSLIGTAGVERIAELTRRLH